MKRLILFLLAALVMPLSASSAQGGPCTLLPTTDRVAPYSGQPTDVALTGVVGSQPVAVWRFNATRSDSVCLGAANPQAKTTKWRADVVLRDTSVVRYNNFASRASAVKAVYTRSTAALPVPPVVVAPLVYDTVFSTYLVSRDSVRAQSTVGAQYEALFDQYAPQHWNNNVNVALNEMRDSVVKTADLRDSLVLATRDTVLKYAASTVTLATGQVVRYPLGRDSVVLVRGNPIRVPNWDARRNAFWSDNYYDRCFAFLAMWRRGGERDTTLYRQGLHYCGEYRRVYLQNGSMAGGGSSTHWWMRDGVVAEYLLTGNDTARVALARQANGFLVTATNQVRWGGAWSDNRIESRYLSTFVDLVRLNGHPSVPMSAYVPWCDDARGWNCPGASWRDATVWQVERILKAQNAAGWWEHTWPCTDGRVYQQAFQAGLLTEALVYAHTYVTPDPRIVTAVANAVTYLHTTQWKQSPAGYWGYQYSNITGCPDLDMQVASDLTGLNLAAYGWLYYQTHDVRWKQWGDEALAAAVRGNYAIGGKQFNQLFKSSWKYFGYVRAAEAHK